MKLSSEQRQWFDGVRSHWHGHIVPSGAFSSQDVFEVGPRVPQSAVSAARVFASRTAALATLPAGGVIAEVGTQTGWFAEQIMMALGPRELHLFDLEFDTLRGARPALSESANVHLHLGDSSTELAKLPDRYFDWIYIDGDHSLEGVRRDTQVAVSKVKRDGIIVFNDYTVWSVLELVDYGIVPVVNELLASGEWKLAYIALHPLMYCDVALRRKARSPVAEFVWSVLRRRRRPPA